MDQNETRAIDEFFDRLAETARTAPPRDGDAEARIAQWSARIPGAAYYLTQTAIVTAHALEAAQQRIQLLEEQLAGADRSAQPHRSGGFLSGLFGGGTEPSVPTRAPAAPPLACPAPGPWGAAAPTASGMFGGGSSGLGGGFGGGGGFLAGAAQTAAGVAGGMLAANAIESLFAGGHEHAGLFGGGQGLFGGAGADASFAASAPREPIDLHYSPADHEAFAANGAGSDDRGGFDDSASSGADSGGSADDSGF